VHTCLLIVSGFEKERKSLSQVHLFAVKELDAKRSWSFNIQIKITVVEKIT